MPINNSLKELMEFFSCPGRPVGAPEFRLFWASCSEEEKIYYKTTPLVMAGEAHFSQDM